MPSIPSISEQYAGASNFVREKGIDVKEVDPAFDLRITEAKEALMREKEEGLRSYNELKAELLTDTAYVGMLGLSAFMVLFSDQTINSYALGENSKEGCCTIAPKSRLQAPIQTCLGDRQISWHYIIIATSKL